MKQNMQCINIGPKGRRFRFIAGALIYLLTYAAALFLIFENYHRGFRALLFLPFFVGTLCLLQARNRTCVVLAARGSQDMDTGPERVQNPSELKALWLKARRILLYSALFSSVVTGICLIAE